MDFDDAQALFDDMPAKSPTAEAPSDKAPTTQTMEQPDSEEVQTVEQPDDKAPTEEAELVNSDSKTETAEEDVQDLAKQEELMKTTAQQARERREAAEREAERQRKERADAKLKELEANKEQAAKEAAAKPPEKPVNPWTAPRDEPVPQAENQSGMPPDISKQEEVMKSTALQARERREAEEREQERQRKERAEAKLKELEAKRQKAKEEEMAKLREENAKKQAAATNSQGGNANGDNSTPRAILERPREQSRFNLWVDPEKPQKQPAATKSPPPPAGREGGREGGRGPFDSSNKFKSDDRDWRARDPTNANSFTLARRPNENNDKSKDSDSNKAKNVNDSKSSQGDGIKQNRREKEQKKREQAAALIHIPKPLPVGAEPLPSQTKPSAEPKPQSPPLDLLHEGGMPDLTWPVKKMRIFCEHHLIPVTRNDSPEQIISKIELAISENGGVLRQKGHGKPRERPTRPEPKPRDTSDSAEDRRDKRRERGGEREKGRRKSSDSRADPHSTKNDSDSKTNGVASAVPKDKTKSGDDKAKQGVPTLEGTGLQPVGDGLLVGMGVAVAQGEVVMDDSGFTTVSAGDKNQRKEEQKKREIAREKEKQEQRRKEKEEQRKREKDAIKAAKAIPAPVAVPIAKPEAAEPEVEPSSNSGDDLRLLGAELDLSLHDGPRAHSIQDLNQQALGAVPKVAWGDPSTKKPVSLLQVQVEETFNKRLDPQYDVELEPQRQGSSSAIGSQRQDNPAAADPWASGPLTAPQAMPGSEGFGTAYQSVLVQPGGLPSGDFNVLQGMGMLQIRPTGNAVGPQPVQTGARFHALGLSSLDAANPFASPFGPSAMDSGVGWSAAPPPVASTANTAAYAFGAPGSASSGAMQFQGTPGDADQWAARPRGAVGSQRAVGGGKRAGGGVQPAPGMHAQQGLQDASAAMHGDRNKRHGRHGKGNNNGAPGPVGPVGPASSTDNSSKSHKQQQKQNGGKGSRRGRGGGGKDGSGGKDGTGGKDGSGESQAATPRAAGEANANKASNNRRGGQSRRGGGGGKQRGEKDGAVTVPVPMPMPVPMPAPNPAM